jgi:putative component of membrane protein insertase Oxa1/YidC/SpoIIIJ protein YidD
MRFFSDNTRRSVKLVSRHVSQMPRVLALLAITAYQRFVSPHKGYSCAYRVYTGRCSCSWLGFRAVRRFGVLRGLGVLRLRFAQCALAFRALASPRRAPRLQAGFVDAALGCDMCGTATDAVCCSEALADFGSAARSTSAPAPAARPVPKPAEPPHQQRARSASSSRARASAP